jgi:hypothetical protein
MPTHDGTFRGLVCDFEGNLAEPLTIFRYFRFFVVSLTA